MHHVHAEVSGTSFSDQSVHVGAVHVEQRALGVEDLGDARDVVLKDADGGGVGKHEGGGFFIDLGSEGFEIDAALKVGLEVLDYIAADGGGSGVGAMSGVGDENLAAGIAS